MLGGKSKLHFSVFCLVSLCLSFFFSSGSFVSTGAHSCDTKERKNRAYHLISAASRVEFSSSAQDLNLPLEAGAAKMGLLWRVLGFSHSLLHMDVCAGWVPSPCTFQLFCYWIPHIWSSQVFLPVAAKYNFNSFFIPSLYLLDLVLGL